MSAWDDLFEGRKWRVLAEATGTVERDGATIAFKGGWFTIEKGAYQSPLSFNKGKRGVMLQEVSDQGGVLSDIPGSIVPVGEGILTRVKSSGALT